MRTTQWQLKLGALMGAASMSTLAFAADQVSTNLTSIKPIHSTNFGIDQTEIEAIKTQMQAAVDGDCIPGALILVGNTEGVGDLETVGYQTSAGVTPVNKDTIFRIYSMTKPIISVAAMPLV